MCFCSRVLVRAEIIWITNWFYVKPLSPSLCQTLPLGEMVLCVVIISQWWLWSSLSTARLWTIYFSVFCLFCVFLFGLTNCTDCNTFCSVPVLHVQYISTFPHNVTHLSFRFFWSLLVTIVCEKSVYFKVQIYLVQSVKIGLDKDALVHHIFSVVRWGIINLVNTPA